jgi:hypothetical protein
LVFARRKGLSTWWPQGGGSAKVDEDGKWAVYTSLGEAKDAGSLFEVSALVVDQRSNESLDEWFRRAERSGTFPGIRLPTPVEGCAAVTVQVERGK